jgi:hypothetical protein
MSQSVLTAPGMGFLWYSGDRRHGAHRIPDTDEGLLRKTVSQATP